MECGNDDESDFWLIKIRFLFYLQTAFKIPKVYVFLLRQKVVLKIKNRGERLDSLRNNMEKK